jgi:hypothetical protein
VVTGPRRTLAAALLVSLLAIACEAPSSTIAATPSRQAGRVDVGGYELAYECRGTGSPTIVTEAGYDSAGTSVFFALLDPLSAISRVCAYDRAGTGTSDARPSAADLTVIDEADELHALLEGAGIEPPYVLVGHSFGGFVSRLFATAFRDETVGLLLIESSHEDEIEPYRRYYGDTRDADWIDGGDLLDIDATAEVLRAGGHDLGNLPVIAMRAERYEDVLSEGLWERTQADLATISTDGMPVVALGSGHAVIDENRPAVLAAVAELVDAAHGARSLAPCEQVFRGIDVDCSP